MSPESPGKFYHEPLQLTSLLFTQSTLGLSQRAQDLRREAQQNLSDPGPGCDLAKPPPLRTSA